jgi:hypothetical protein
VSRDIPLPESWQGPPPVGPTYASCGQRCPDCEQVVSVAGTWEDWDRIHGSVCTRGQMVLPLEVAT